MTVWVTITICFGIIAGFSGVSSAQDSVAQSGISHKTKTFGDMISQLMLEQIEPVEAPSDHTQTDTLDDLIRQVRCLQIPSKSIPPESGESIPSQPSTAETSPPLEESRADEEDQGPVPEDDLAVMLEKINEVVSPLRLADVLYRQGRYELAFKNYATVYEQLGEDCVSDCQWVLFQKANCCRHSDLNEAIELYKELIESYPNSRWTAAASSRLKMSQWYQLSQIRELTGNKTNDAIKQ